MIGDPGPYGEPNGPLVLVPRTVPYLDARRLAKEAAQYGEGLRYLGKEEARLIGFARDCQCEGVCELAGLDGDGDTVCRVPTWKFELVEP